MGGHGPPRRTAFLGGMPSYMLSTGADRNESAHLVGTAAFVTTVSVIASCSGTRPLSSRAPLRFGLAALAHPGALRRAAGLVRRAASSSRGRGQLPRDSRTLPLRARTTTASSYSAAFSVTSHPTHPSAAFMSCRSRPSFSSTSACLLRARRRGRPLRRASEPRTAPSGCGPSAFPVSPRGAPPGMQGTHPVGAHGAPASWRTSRQEKAAHDKERRS